MDFSLRKLEGKQRIHLQNLNKSHVDTRTNRGMNGLLIMTILMLKNDHISHVYHYLYYDNDHDSFELLLPLLFIIAMIISMTMITNYGHGLFGMTGISGSP